VHKTLIGPTILSVIQTSNQKKYLIFYLKDTFKKYLAQHSAS
jgi:hypothetical protein